MKKILLSAVIFSIIGFKPAIAVETIEILGLFKDKAVVKIDGKRQVLSKGETSSEGATLISADSKEAIIEIDGKQRPYKLGSKISSSFSEAAAGKTVFISSGPLGHYYVNGSINGFSTDFVVDTGASLIAMNSNVAKRLGLDYKLEGKEGRASTASGVVKTYFLNLKRVRVGDIELNNIQGSVIEGDFPEITLLGMSFLGKLNMSHEGKLLQLEKKY